MPVISFDPVSTQKWQIEFYFDIYRRSLVLQDELASQAFEDWNRKIDEEAQQYDEDQRDLFYEFHNEEHTAREYSKTIVMNSFFVGAYALYEHHRKRVKRRHSISKGDFMGSQLQQSPEWQEIEHYRKIRNRIMHNGGVIPDCVCATVYAKNKDITTDYLHPSTYALTRSFCDEALDNFEKCLLNAIDEFGSK